MERLSTRDHGSWDEGRGSPAARSSGGYAPRSGMLGIEERVVWEVGS